MGSPKGCRKRKEPLWKAACEIARALQRITAKRILIVRRGDSVAELTGPIVAARKLKSKGSRKLLISRSLKS